MKERNFVNEQEKIEKTLQMAEALGQPRDEAIVRQRIPKNGSRRLKLQQINGTMLHLLSDRDRVLSGELHDGPNGGVMVFRRNLNGSAPTENQIIQRMQEERPTWRNLVQQANYGARIVYEGSFGKKTTVDGEPNRPILAANFKPKDV